jgi:hypothetical protein
MLSQIAVKVDARKGQQTQAQVAARMMQKRNMIHIRDAF